MRKRKNVKWLILMMITGLLAAFELMSMSTYKQKIEEENEKTNNIFKIGDFEKGVLFKKWPGNAPVQMSIAPGKGLQGSSALYIKKYKLGTARVSGLFDALPEKKYKIEFYYKIIHYKSMKKSFPLYFFYKRKGVKRSTGYHEIKIPIGKERGKWIHFEDTFTTAAASDIFSVGFKLDNAIFTGYVDDVFIYPAPPLDNAKKINPFRINRPVKFFSTLQGDDPAQITVTSWYAGGGTRAHLKENKTLSEADIERIEKETLEELSTSGSMGRFSPQWEKNFGGIDKTREVYKKYGIKTILYFESSGVMAKAIENGAEILSRSPWGASKKGVTSTIIPEYGRAALEISLKLARKYGNLEWVKMAYGRDEPANGELSKHLSLTLNPGSQFIRGFDKYTKQHFGFQKYGVPDYHNLDQYRNDLGRKLANIAVARAWTEKYLENRREINTELKKINRNLKYIPCNFNFIGGIRFHDYSEYDESAGDIISGDPYASKLEGRARGRGRYNHGFGTKFLKDLTHIPEIMTIVQAFGGGGYNPSLEDLAEWISQALKMGADHINYFDPSKYKQIDPEIYQGLLAITKKITQMKKLKIPTKAEVAVLYSTYSHMADGITVNGNEIYTAYALLGEKLHSWFKFVSDRDIEKGKVDLSTYKILFIPYMNFGSQKIYDNIVNFLASGKTVVFLDPNVFEYDIEGNSHANLREQVIGIQTGKARNEEQVVIKNNQGHFPLYKRYSVEGDREKNGLEMKITRKEIEVLGEYKDHTPAIVKGDYKSGKFYYFAHNPMISDILLTENNWDAFFAKILQEHNIAMDHKIWDFHLDDK